MQNNFSLLQLDQDDYSETFAIYQEICQMVVSSGGHRDYSINDDAFADAMKSIEDDINILLFRRKIHTTGISDGKVAGVYAFRLARSPIISFCPHGGIHQPQDKQINATVALLVALRCIKLPLNSLQRKTTKELIYSILKRHTNQETIAMVIDSAINSFSE